MYRSGARVRRNMNPRFKENRELVHSMDAWRTIVRREVPRAASVPRDYAGEVARNKWRRVACEHVPPSSLSLSRPLPPPPSPPPPLVRGIIAINPRSSRATRADTGHADKLRRTYVAAREAPGGRAEKLLAAAAREGWSERIERGKKHLGFWYYIRKRTTRR